MRRVGNDKLKIKTKIRAKELYMGNKPSGGWSY